MQEKARPPLRRPGLSYRLAFRLEVETQLQLELACRRQLGSRRAFEGYRSKWIRVVEIEDRAAIIGRGAEARRRRAGRRMIENVPGIHSDLAREGFTDFETLGHRHIRVPDSCRFNGVQTDIASRSGLRVLQDDTSRLFCDGAQSAERSQACIN